MQSNIRKGERHGRSKYTTKTIIEMRRLYATGDFIYRELAERFDMPYQTVASILSRKSWDAPEFEPEELRVDEEEVK